MKDALEQALEYRREIHQLAQKEDNASQREKRRLLDHAEHATERIRLVADACVGAFFAEAKDKAREGERGRRMGIVERWLGGEEALEAEVQGMAAEIREQHAPFHWWLEFPEVFYEERPDPLDGGKVNGAACMEAFVGNPPFMGGPNVSFRLGGAYVDWLKATVDGDRGNRGQVDLSAYFFRRVAHLLGNHGTFGLVATNTIGQGDTRALGLKELIARRWRIYDATTSFVWPGSAAVVVAMIHGAYGKVEPYCGIALLDGAPVAAISSRLLPGAERPDATPLLANEGSAFLGVLTYGNGFLLTPEEAHQLVEQGAKNASRIEPYIGGEEINTSPTQSNSRHAINFGALTLDQAAQWPDLLDILRARVKPERDKLPPKNSVNRDRRDRWWQFAGRSPELYSKLAGLDTCLVTAQVSKHRMFSFQPSSRIFSQKVYVFPMSETTPFGVLQSRVHEPWVTLLSSTMKTDVSYSASDCFDTFPFPKPDPRTIIPQVEAAGQAFYAARARFMIETDQGLTKTYNALKDPDNADPAVVELRRLTEAMDRAVLDAYGWTDLEVPPYCPKTPAERAALKAFENEVIDRLYVLNAERVREEQRLGLGKTAGKKKPGKKSKPNSGQTSLV